MGLQDDFVAPVGVCLNPHFTFPPITAPGLPNFALGCFLGTFAGINFVLQFIPPTPDILPNIKPPGIDLFLQAFLGGIMLPSSYPSFSLGPLTIPAIGSPPYARPMDGELKLMGVMIVLPFQLIVTMVEKLLQLQIALPTLDGIYAIFVDLAMQAGLSGQAVAKFGLCIAESIFNLFTSLI